jgi:alpha-glucosidase
MKDYPGFYLSGRGDAGLGVMVTLPPRFDNNRDFRFRQTVSANVQLKGQGFQTPWRVVMLGDTPGDLTASSLIPTLAAPSQIKDTSWIKPSKTAWDWWNDWAVNVPNAGVNTATYKAFVDFSKEMKLDDILIDEGWSVGSDIEPNPQADVTRAKPEMDMPAAAIREIEKRRRVAVGAVAAAGQPDGRRLRAVRRMGHQGREGGLHEPQRPGDGRLVSQGAEQGRRA